MIQFLCLHTVLEIKYAKELPEPSSKRNVLVKLLVAGARLLIRSPHQGRTLGRIPIDSALARLSPVPI